MTPVPLWQLRFNHSWQVYDPYLFELVMTEILKKNNHLLSALEKGTKRYFLIINFHCLWQRVCKINYTWISIQHYNQNAMKPWTKQLLYYRQWHPVSRALAGALLWIRISLPLFPWRGRGREEERSWVVALAKQINKLFCASVRKLVPLSTSYYICASWYFILFCVTCSKYSKQQSRVPIFQTIVLH